MKGNGIVKCTLYWIEFIRFFTYRSRGRIVYKLHFNKLPQFSILVEWVRGQLVVVLRLCPPMGCHVASLAVTATPPIVLRFGAYTFSILANAIRSWAAWDTKVKTRSALMALTVTEHVTFSKVDSNGKKESATKEKQKWTPESHD